MNEEMYNELFKDVVICGRYPLEKLDEMKWFIRSLEDKITILEKENKELKEKIEIYENPEDFTQIFMHCDEIRKDTIKHLKSVIKEIREYINKNKLYNYKYDEEELFEIITDEVAKTDLLQILDKGEQ